MPKVRVRSNGDCGFDSAAWLFVDSFLQDRLKEENLLGFAQVCARHYPHLVNPNLSIKENFKQLIEVLPKDMLIETLSYALRQYAVDTMVKNPENYRGAFTNKTEGTDPQAMRRPGTWIDAQALQAIFSGFNMAVKVQAASYSPILGSNSKNNPVAVLYLSGKHYEPEVSNKTLNQLNADKQSAITNAQAQETNLQDPSLKEIIAKIEKFDAGEKQREAKAKSLLSKLDTSTLLSLYREQMEKSDYLPGRISHVTDEHQGNLFFFNAIINKEVDPKKTNELRSELIHALSKEVYREPSFIKTIEQSSSKNQAAIHQAKGSTLFNTQVDDVSTQRNNQRILSK